MERALVRSTAKLTYQEAQESIDDGTASEVLQLLKEVGLLRLTREAARGGIDLPTLEQEVHVEDDRFSLEFRDMLPVESWNAQMSLLTGFAAASLMVYARVGLLRTLPDPDHRDVQRLHRTARALGIEWPAELLYADLIRELDPTEPDQAALIVVQHPAAARERLRRLRRRDAGRAAPRGARRRVRARHRAAAPAGRPLRLRGVRRPVRRRRGARLGPRRDPRPAEHDAADRPARGPLRADGARPGRGGRPAVARGGVVRRRGGAVNEQEPTRGTVTVREPAVEAPVVSASPLPLGTEAQVRLTTADVARPEGRVHPRVSPTHSLRAVVLVQASRNAGCSFISSTSSAATHWWAALSAPSWSRSRSAARAKTVS